MNSSYLLRIMVFVVMGRSTENIEEKEKTERSIKLKRERKTKNTRKVK